MARSQEKSKRKVSGGRYHSYRTKRKYELASFPAMTKLFNQKKVRVSRTIGGNTKRSLLNVKEINVADKKGKTKKTEILNVLENPGNPNFVIRNIITKGSIVETKLGKAKVTGRPGQEGSVNGILI